MMQECAGHFSDGVSILSQLHAVDTGLMVYMWSRGAENMELPIISNRMGHL